MDTLSSQANLSGYRAVIEALAVFPRFSKAQVTAAGKVAPCTVLVIGAGVAGMHMRLGMGVIASEYVLVVMSDERASERVQVSE